jgi:hypothetical protein
VSQCILGTRLMMQFQQCSCLDSQEVSDPSILAKVVHILYELRCCCCSRLSWCSLATGALLYWRT